MYCFWIQQKQKKLEIPIYFLLYLFSYLFSCYISFTFLHCIVLLSESNAWPLWGVAVIGGIEVLKAEEPKVFSCSLISISFIHSQLGFQTKKTQFLSICAFTQVHTIKLSPIPKTLNYHNHISVWSIWNRYLALVFFHIHTLSESDEKI